MITIINALAPIFLIVLGGVFLNYLRFPGDDFWPMAERFTYYILFPALLIFKLGTATFEQIAAWEIIFAVSLPLIIVSTLLLILSKWFWKNGPAFTSLFQGSVRFNTYVGLAASQQIFGEDGLIIAAMVIAVMIPLINVLCITVFALKTSKKAPSIQGLLWEITKNPLIIGCFIGILLNLSGATLPFWSVSFLEILSQPALPLGLLAVGASLKLTDFTTSISAIVISSSIKLLIIPVVAWAAGSTIGISGLTLQIVTLFFCLPTAPSAYILARQLGGDHKQMATIITAQALLAMLTMPLMLLWIISF
ncbi:MAG: AEC family transporter [Magnetococcales bacterium]|nr:AEC family transporter [Magnetococcales bacterium]